jgi:glucokinase
MSASPDYLAGIDLGGSSVKAAAVTPEGVALAKRTIAFDAQAGMEWASVAREILRTFIREFGGAPQAVGLSAPGLASNDGRSIAHMPGRLSGLEGLDWTGFLRTERPARILNDAHAALLGEAWLGAAKGRRNVAMLTLGTGVGGALLLDGQIFRGHIGRAGHLGHITVDSEGKPDITGLPGSLEDAIGNCSISRRTAGRFATTHELIAASLAGDAAASAVWLKSVRGLACGLASIINVVDPELVVIGGGIARAGDALFVPLREFLAKMEWRPGGHAVEVVPASQGEFAGAFGAAVHAWRSAP